MSQMVQAPGVPVKRFTAPPMNRFMVWLLQSPLHPLVSGSHLLVKYRGRKTGIERCLPVGYARHDDMVVILVGRAVEKTWWRNFLTKWPMTLVIHGREVRGTGVVVRGETDEGAAPARAYFRRYPRRARARGLTFRQGNPPDLDVFRSAADGLTFVRVSLFEEASR